MMQLVARATYLHDSVTLAIQILESRLLKSLASLKAKSEAVDLIFAHAALIYLHTIVSGASARTPEIEQSVTRCLAVVERLPSCLLIRMCWPFTVAGCMAIEDQYDNFRGVVRRALTAKEQVARGMVLENHNEGDEHKILPI